MPMDVPLLGRPPARFEDGEKITSQYRTDFAALSGLIPQPLEPINDTVMIQISRWGDVAGLGRNTYECNIMLAARFKRGGKNIVGAYSPYFYVNSDKAMAGGREFHGQPKRIGEVSMEVHGDLIVGTVARNGVTFLRTTLPYKARLSSLAELRGRVNLVTGFNLKILPHIDATTAVRQITARDFVDIKMAGCWSGQSTTEIHPHATCPIYRLPVLEQLEGYYWKADFSLVGGVILHDYLKAPKKGI